jgi:GNAT superfamily N-acetyltransferase
MGLHLSSKLGDSTRDYTTNKMIEFNYKHFPDELKGRYQEVHISLQDDEGQMYGGIIGEICWNWMEIEYLFVEENKRALGYGTQLLEAAEAMAKEKGCDYAKVDTLSFQALDFYKKLGYEVYGTIDQAGRQFTHYYLKKDL